MNSRSLNKTLVAVVSVVLFLTVLRLQNPTIAHLKNDESVVNLGVFSKDQDYEFNDLIRNQPTDQADERLLANIRTHVIPPNSKSIYNLKNMAEDFDHTQLKIQPAIDAIFGGARNGVFVESGAYDGEKFSTTLHLERNYNWTGLLVEPNPKNFDNILLKGRHSWLLNACLSPVPFATHLPLTLHGSISEIFDIANGQKQMERNEAHKKYRNGNTNVETVLSKCYPTYSVLKALSFTEVDFFSLDIESAELMILRTIPFTRLNVKVWLIEWNKVDHGELDDFMESNNYKRIDLVEMKVDRGLDAVYIKNDLTLPVKI